MGPVETEDIVQSNGSEQDVIDWSNIKTLDDVERLGPLKLYDHTPEEGQFDLLIANDLTDYEMEDAKRWARFINGVILVTGPPGTGKTTLLHVIAWKMKRYFGKLVTSDAPPRHLFGLSIPNSTEFLLEQLDRVHDLMYDHPEYSQFNTDPMRWYSSKGQIFLKHTVMLEDEFSNKMPRETPNLSICQIYQRIATIWRHFDILILGATTKKEDITPHLYPEVTAEIRCKALASRPGVYRGMLYPLKYNSSKGTFMSNEKPIIVDTDALSPIEAYKHPPLAGYRWVDLFNSKNPQVARVPEALRKQLKKKARERGGL